jgi:hypothetical protein
MKITPGEKSQLISEGLTTLVCLAALIGAILFFGNYLIQKELDSQNQVADANKNLLASNRRDAREIKFLRENQRSIENMWSTLKNWGSGITAADLEPFEIVGILDKTPLPAAKTPTNPIQYGGMKITGTKTEFQRILQALTQSEASSGLLQIRSAILQIPNSTLPYSPRPTYLEAQLEIVGPLSQ